MPIVNLSWALTGTVHKANMIPRPITHTLKRLVVYLSPADKYHRLIRRLSQGQKGLEERALMVSQRPSEPW